MQIIRDTVWWITGASSGIGRSLALYILTNGGNVVLSSRNTEALERLAVEAGVSGDRYLVLPLDLERMEGIEIKVHKVLSKFSHIDFLINNGGISQRSLASETDIAVDRRIMETNFFGSVILTKAVLPVMIKQHKGHIAVVSSVVGKFGFPLRSAYSASKQALHGFFESLRAENVSNNIKVSIIIPGRINTAVSNNALSKDGTAYGMLDQGQAKSMSPDKAAPIIVKGILKEKKEIMVGGKELLMVYIRRFIPPLYYYLANKVSAT